MRSVEGVGRAWREWLQSELSSAVERRGLRGATTLLLASVGCFGGLNREVLESELLAGLRVKSVSRGWSET